MKKNDTLFFYYAIKNVKVVDKLAKVKIDKLETLLQEYIEPPPKEYNDRPIDNIIYDIDNKHYITLVIIQKVPIYKSKPMYDPKSIYLCNFNILLNHDGFLPTIEIPLEHENFKYKPFIRKVLSETFNIPDKYVNSIKKIDIANSIDNYHNYMVLTDPVDLGFKSICYRRGADIGSYFLDNLTYFFSPDSNVEHIKDKKLIEILISNRQFTNKSYYDLICQKNKIEDLHILNTLASIFN